MGYTLEGLLLDDAAASAPRRLHAIPLSQHITLIPLTNEIVDALPGSAERASIGGEFWKLDQAIEKLIRSLSEHGRVAYIEANFHAGQGTQDAAVWQSGQLILGPLHSEGRGAINQALRALGVGKGNAEDEFDAVGLGQFRHTEGWF